ncbi:TVP38/TMEM64 family protein [Litchfieldia salsa]|uniref:TVP38/TMEM64 family membrane protein n=1 Tax=Litchfieldia salsa TaxID=930152 RepID=A0A1H0WQ52_9BACI|nr:VTT domain-containing protein [Litchfieldia salsa]SDP92386.1 Uncharacterized membrane protein YdjX, TVP38/TMEM64 family, SNARE-associated domain [Litchfieldia salsa]
MQEQLIEFLVKHAEIAVLISIFINIVISIVGVIPSFFLTAANIIVFGFWEGMFVSFVGEALGAGLAFWLYRKGLKRIVQRETIKNKLILKLLEVRGMEAFYSIIFLRLLPFVPSGIVTIVAAMGKVSGLTFILASSIGKVPALVMESYSVYHISEWTEEGKVVLTIFALIGLILMIYRIKRNLDMKQSE